jgi:hypothetical protein
MREPDNKRLELERAGTTAGGTVMTFNAGRSAVMR